MMSVVVIDTSAVLAVVLNEPSKASLIACTQGATLIAPESLPWEVGNALSAMFKQKRLTLAEALAALESYHTIPIRLFALPLEHAVMIAHQADIYAYDAYVLACAQIQSAAIVSIDRGLKRAATALGIPFVEEAA